jgi:hypothetical protein
VDGTIVGCGQAEGEYQVHLAEGHLLRLINKLERKEFLRRLVFGGLRWSNLLIKETTPLVVH